MTVKALQVVCETAKVSTGTVPHQTKEPAMKQILETMGDLLMALPSLLGLRNSSKYFEYQRSRTPKSERELQHERATLDKEGEQFLKEIEGRTPNQWTFAESAWY